LRAVNYGTLRGWRQFLGRYADWHYRRVRGLVARSLRLRRPVPAHKIGNLKDIGEAVDALCAYLKANHHSFAKLMA
jgi:hypothetical protein